MINSATLPEAKLHNKRHNTLSFHFVHQRNILTAKFINLQHINSKFNISDIVSKHWSYQSVYANLLWPTFYFEGDTGHLFDDDTLTVNCYSEFDVSNNITVHLMGNEKSTKKGEHQMTWEFCKNSTYCNCSHKLVKQYILSV